jgi:DNA-binding IclR family transcriptional regulator
VYSEERIVAALSFVIPSYRVTASEATRCGELLVSAAAELSAQLSRSPKPDSEERQS